MISFHGRESLSKLACTLTYHGRYLNAFLALAIQLRCHIFIRILQKVGERYSWRICCSSRCLGSKEMNPCMTTVSLVSQPSQFVRVTDPARDCLLGFSLRVRRHKTHACAGAIRWAHLHQGSFCTDQASRRRC